MPAVLSARRRHFFCRRPNAILIAESVLLFFHRKVDRTLDERKNDLIDTRLLGCVMDI